MLGPPRAGGRVEPAGGPGTLKGSCGDLSLMTRQALSRRVLVTSALPAIAAQRGEQKAPPFAGVASGLVTSPTGAGAPFVFLVSHLRLCSLHCGLDVLDSVFQI